MNKGDEGGKRRLMLEEIKKNRGKDDGGKSEGDEKRAVRCSRRYLYLLECQVNLDLEVHEGATHGKAPRKFERPAEILVNVCTFKTFETQLTPFCYLPLCLAQVPFSPGGKFM